MTQLKNKKKSRAGYKGYLSYAFPEVNKCLKDYTEDIKNEIERWKEALRIFIFARPSDQTSTVGDSWIFPYVSKL